MLLLNVLVLYKELLLVDDGELEGGVNIIVVINIIDLILNQHRKHSQVMLLTQLQLPYTIYNTQLNRLTINVMLIVVIILTNLQELLNIPSRMHTLWIVE